MYKRWKRSMVAGTNWRIAALAVALILGAVAPTWAGDSVIDAAKAQGSIGETARGYLAVVPGSAFSEAVKQKLDQINQGRRAAYLEIAGHTDGAVLSDVEQLAGKKLIEQAPSRQFVRGTNGVWVKKP